MFIRQVVMKNLFVIWDLVRLMIFLTGLSFILAACGHAPECPRTPGECTPEAVYGPLCQTQPWYTLNGDAEQTAVYNQTCGNLLGGK